MSENLALNFFLRALSPAVFIIAISALLVAIGRAEWRVGIHWVAIYYFFIRASAIVLLSRHRLISWPRFVLHAAAGIAFALLSYYYLILPNRSLLPDVDQMGNELWLAMLAFLYAVANKVPVAGGPGARRRTGFVRVNYQRARSGFGRVIDQAIADDQLRLITYAVLIYEDYARPSAIRWIERLMFWKSIRTTGIMQVAGSKPLSDADSVAQGVEILRRSWEATTAEDGSYQRVRSAISKYNADDDYIARVMDIMELLAKRVDVGFRPAREYLAVAPPG